MRSIIDSAFRLGDIVNHWRIHTLDLEAVPATEGPQLVETLKVPFTYCWSPSLVVKPYNWGDHIGRFALTAMSLIN